MNKHLVLFVMALFCITPVVKADASIFESFSITTENVIIKETTASSIKLKSENDSYFIQLEPNEEGRVVFSLAGFGYASTARLSNLEFKVKISGYLNGDIIHPTFSFDDVNKNIKAEQNTVTFQRINGTIPVWFSEQVDSVNLEYSNSLNVDVQQFLRIQDMKIMPEIDVTSNPDFIPCDANNVMIGIDGSSSISKQERNLIGKKMREFVKQSSTKGDSNQICILEFGSEIKSVEESFERRSLMKTIKKYKRNKGKRLKSTIWTNWSVAFDEAIKRKPGIFIFITDGWSNWVEKQPRSFSAQYEDLISKSNTLKENGTRLLFITSDIDRQNSSKAILDNFLDLEQTREIQDEMITYDVDLNDVDLITMTGFSQMADINFSSILKCSPKSEEVVISGVKEIDGADLVVEEE